MSRLRRSGQRDLVLRKALAVGIELFAPQARRRNGRIRSVQPLRLRDLDITVHGIVAGVKKLLRRHEGLSVSPPSPPLDPEARAGFAP